MFQISKSPKAWAVIFYATWCGGCQAYAPTWIDFANDIPGMIITCDM